MASHLDNAVKASGINKPKDKDKKEEKSMHNLDNKGNKPK